MKVRVKETGEILEYEYLSNVYAGTQNSINIDEVEFIQDETPVNNFDWVSRRYELYKSNIFSLLNNTNVINYEATVKADKANNYAYNAFIQQVTNIAADCADALIEKLKAE